MRPLLASSPHGAVMSVANAPGRMQFTRTFGASASAKPIVNAFKPALAQA